MTDSQEPRTTSSGGGRRELLVAIRRHGEPPQRSLSISMVWVWLAGMLFAAFVVTAVFAAKTYVDTMSRLRDYSELVVEVDHLRNQNLVLRELELELRELKEFQRKMLKLAGIKPALRDLQTNLPDLDADDADAESLFGSHPLLMWPVEGEILRAFSADHPAVDLAAEVKTPVSAAGRGVVQSAGRHPELGPRLVVAHNDSLTTVYAGNEVLMMAVGDTVKAGDVIALSGEGYEPGPAHLHFEVRIGGQPVDPQLHIPDLFHDDHGH